MTFTYRLIGLLVGSFWLIMMTLLVSRDILPELRPLPTSGYQEVLTPVEDQPRVERMGYYLGTKRLGFTQTTYRKRPGGDYEIENESEFSLAEMGLGVGGQLPGGGGIDSLAARFHTIARVGSDYQLKRFNVHIDMAGEKQQILGVMIDGKLNVTTVMDGKKERRELPFDGRAILGGKLFPADYSGRLRIGHAWDVVEFDPFSGRPATASREVIRREKIVMQGKLYDTYVVKTRIGKNKPTYAWVDAEGRLVREERPFNIRLEREPVPESEK